MELDEEHTKCSVCVTEFSFDRDNKDPEIRKHLPVLSSSQRCDHWFCHGCILREQLRVAEENNGRIPKWLKCMHCREKTSFNPAEPKYHRLLIDLLARAQAARVKSEEQESKVDVPFITDVTETTMTAGMKRKTPPETADTAPEKSKSKSSKETEEGTRKSDDGDDAKKTANYLHKNASPEEFGFTEGSVHYELAKSFLSWSEGGYCFLNWKNDLSTVLYNWECFILQPDDTNKEVTNMHIHAVAIVSNIRQKLVSTAMKKNSWETFYAEIDVVIREILKDDQPSEGNVGIDEFAAFVQYKFHTFYHLGLSLKKLYFNRVG